MKLDNDGFSVKMVESKSYVRLSRDCEPQLVRVEPHILKNGAVDRERVAMWLDDHGPEIVPRHSAEALLRGNECIPLEEMLNFKHWWVH